MVSQILDLAGKEGQTREYKRGKYQCTVDLLGISCMTTDNFGFYLQNILIQTRKLIWPLLMTKKKVTKL